MFKTNIKYKYKSELAKQTAKFTNDAEMSRTFGLVQIYSRSNVRGQLLWKGFTKRAQIRVKQIKLLSKKTISESCLFVLLNLLLLGTFFFWDSAGVYFYVTTNKRTHFCILLLLFHFCVVKSAVWLVGYGIEVDSSNSTQVSLMLQLYLWKIDFLEVKCSLCLTVTEKYYYFFSFN